jgi:ribosomal protein L16 Arg81 hydroxylase
MNSPFVLRQIQAAENSYLAKLLKEELLEEEKITRLFQRFLVRNPTPAEIANAKSVIQRDAVSNKGWENLQWLLINKVEFVHNF